MHRQESMAPASVPRTSEIEKIFQDLYAKYYGNSDPHDVRHRVRRGTFHVELILRSPTNPPSRICDIGGLFGDIASVCSALGVEAMFVDDFQDQCHFDENDRRFEIHKQYGAQAIRRDVIAEGIDFPNNSIDVFSCFASMEHWHHSPKKLFGQIVQALKPGGAFVLSAPNCVDLPKRISVPLGRGSWSTMDAWYESPLFRNHVREPSVADFRYIARDMGLTNVQILGRNWNAHQIRNPLLRGFAIAVDKSLHVVPTLCTEIYLVGQKQLGSSQRSEYGRS